MTTMDHDGPRLRACQFLPVLSALGLQRLPGRRGWTSQTCWPPDAAYGWPTDSPRPISLNFAVLGPSLENLPFCSWPPKRGNRWSEDPARSCSFDGPCSKSWLPLCPFSALATTIASWVAPLPGRTRPLAYPYSHQHQSSLVVADQHGSSQVYTDLHGPKSLLDSASPH